MGGGGAVLRGGYRMPLVQGMPRLAWSGKSFFGVTIALVFLQRKFAR